MNFRPTRDLLASVAAPSLILLSAGASAQELPPQSEYYIGADQVELYRGAFLHTNRDIRSGPAGNGGLQYVRDASDLHIRVDIEPYVYSTDPPSNLSYTYKLNIGRHVEVFDRQYGSTVTTWPVKGGGQFSVSGQHAGFTYTAGDGTVTQFGSAETGKFTATHALWQERPDGTRLTFHYDTSTSSSGSVPQTRLRLVTNNHGFGIGFLFFSGLNHERLSEVCAVNLAVSYASASSPCPTGAPRISYTYTSTNPLTGQLSGFTDLAGNTTQYSYTSYNNVSLLTGIRLPGSSADDLTVTYDSSNFKVASLKYADNASWTYTYQNNLDWHTSPHNAWTDVTDPLGRTVRHYFSGGAAPKPYSVTDPLHRTVQYRFVTNSPHLLWKEIQPDSSYVEYSYDNRDNRTQVRRVEAPGSTNLDDILSSAFFTATPTYPYTCTNPKTCNQPAYTIDPNDNRTDYTYGTAHGEVLTVTGPAVNGVRPQTRHEYVQRYAGIKNSSGAYVQAATPVWMRTATSFCRTSAATGNPSAPCVTAGDEVRTTYEYGPTTGPNNLLLRGEVVTADGVSLRTCYGYDQQGRRISETRPKANLTSCP